MIPPYRLCNQCHAEGRETRIGTKDAPLITVSVGLVEDGLSYDAVLPRFAWKLWTRYHADRDQLEPVPAKVELCPTCAVALVADSGALAVVSQADYLSERRALSSPLTPT